MSRYHSYINSAAEILNSYSGNEPFALFIKKYFASHKKFGSKDRKQVSHLCYCYFRLGKMGKDLSIGERILWGLFLCSREPNDLLAGLKPEWNDESRLSLGVKCSMLEVQYSIREVFPWADELSEGMEHEKFCESFFTQPGLFIRLRPGYQEKVMTKLADSNIAYETVDDNCLELANAVKIDSIIDLDKEAVVQDLNSQRVVEMFELAQITSGDVWDCCAGSGGKSLMIHDLRPAVQITVSDKRESILTNLKKRFAKAGIDRYKSFIANLTQKEPVLKNSQFDLIIADVPCTGSGTWSRTPEQLYFFDEHRVDEYADLQRKIVSNVIPHLKKGSFLLYSTCSAFKKENEEAVAFITKQFGLRLIKMELLKGYDKKADTLFAALLQAS